MTVRMILPFLLLCLFLPAKAENAALPRIRYTEEEDSASAVVPTGKIAERPDPDHLTLNRTDKNSLAAAIALDDTRYDWAPGIDRSQASGPAAIRDAALSGDASVLAVLERLGEVPGPYGSRIVFFNTANGTILRYVEMNDAECTRLCFTRNALLVLKKGADDQHDELLTLSLVPFTGKAEKTFSFPQRVSGFAAGADETLWVKYGVTLSQFSPGGEKTGSWKLRSSGGKIVYDPKENRIFTLFPGRIERNRPDHGRLIAEDTLDFDGTPEYAIVVQDWLLAGESGLAPQLLFCDEKTSPLRLASTCTGAGVFDRSGLLFMVLDRNRDIGVFRLPGSPRPSMLIKVNNLRPQTNGEIRFLFRMPGKNLVLLALDDRANLMRLNTKKRNVFQKTLLFSPAEGL